jgi:hypothetical protein
MESAESTLSFNNFWDTPVACLRYGSRLIVTT